VESLLDSSESTELRLMWDDLWMSPWEEVGGGRPAGAPAPSAGARAGGCGAGAAAATSAAASCTATAKHTTAVTTATSSPAFPERATPEPRTERSGNS